MPERDPLAPFLGPLERLGLPYCVTGSVAASVYGEPRLTADVDVVLLMALQDIALLRAVFPDETYYVPPDETLRLAIARGSRGMFNLIHHESQFKGDIYLAARDPLHAWALANRRRVELDTGSMWLAPPEYVIVRKLEIPAQDKHVLDVRFMLAATPVDSAWIENAVERLGLGPQWERCRQGG